MGLPWWRRVRLPTQRTRVRALVREDPTCHGAAGPICHSYQACALEPVSPRATAAEACVPGAHALQQKRPPW